MHHGTRRLVTLAHEIPRRVRIDGEITLSIDGIITATRTTDRRGVRERSFWRAAQRGEKVAAAFAKESLVIEFRPDETGKSVVSGRTPETPFPHPAVCCTAREIPLEALCMCLTRIFSTCSRLCLNRTIRRWATTHRAAASKYGPFLGLLRNV